MQLPKPHHREVSVKKSVVLLRNAGNWLDQRNAAVCLGASNPSALLLRRAIQILNPRVCLSDLPKLYESSHDV
jgi:hypothetical protein